MGASAWGDFCASQHCRARCGNFAPIRVGLCCAQPAGRGEPREDRARALDQQRNTLEYEIDRIFCNDDYLFHEGILRIVFPGYFLEKAGLPIDDPGAWYLYSYRTAAIFPYAENGLAKGEDVYSDGPLSMDRVHKLAPDEIPDALPPRALPA